MPCWNRQQYSRQELDQSYVPQVKGTVRDLENLPTNCDRLHLRSDDRECATHLEQPEIAVLKCGSRRDYGFGGIGHALEYPTSNAHKAFAGENPDRIISRVLSPICRKLVPPLMFLSATMAIAQSTPIVSPEVQSDNRAIFRFRAPNAQKVELQLEGRTEHIPMQKDDAGVWIVTTDPLQPDYYGYAFVADGVSLIDPRNPLTKPNLLNPQSMVHVPGPALPWEVNEVPHGVVHHHFFKSGVVGDQRDYYVYTPPDYNAAGKKKKYPVLYLLHGYSDDASGWTAVGRANVIVDNLIAQQKAEPMIVVMPLGYGDLEMLSRGSAAFSHNDLRQRNLEKFRESLLTEIIPRVEKDYQAAKDRNSRAIAGLSMGGSESMFVGLTSADRFGWIGAFSTGGLSDNFDQQFAEMKPKEVARFNLLWIACGTDDHLIDANRRLREWLTSKDVKHIDVDTPGAHTWMVWRRNLEKFAPLLFQGK